MSNRVSLHFTNFQSINSKGKVIDEFVGYRISDDYGQDYNNLFESMEELNDTINYDTIFDYVKNNHYCFFESIEEREGMYFNGNWIEYIE